MKQTRKGNQWYFGMKLHIGTDRKGRVHHVTATNAAAADITQMESLLHGKERRYPVNRRAASRTKPLSERWRAINRARSRTRARGEHPFHAVKRLWGFTKVRYRGLAKNLARAQTMFPLANLFLVRRQLLPTDARYTL